jgi:hypothetical protein
MVEMDLPTLVQPGMNTGDGGDAGRAASQPELGDGGSNPPCGDDNFWEATERWVRAVEGRFARRDPHDLTQVFMRGPFAGWSEHDVYRLAAGLRESMDKYPLWGNFNMEAPNA